MITNVVSFGGHTFNASEYEVDFVVGTQPRLPVAQVSLLERVGAYPVISALTRKANRLALMITIVDTASVNTLRAQLFNWFDPEDETPKKLVVNSTGSIEQYVYAITEELRLYSTPRDQQCFVATLVVDGDARWTDDDPKTDTWNLTASGATQAITNAGEDDAYPVYTIKPTTGKTASYLYRKWIAVKWLSRNAGPRYPIAITTATDALVGASKMQADGDDLRVFVDGVEVYRWLHSMNSAATKIWFATNFAGCPLLTLKTAIAGSGPIGSIELNQDISSLPDSGILYIGTEAFVYTGRDVIDQAMTGITRAAKGTSEGAHSASDAVYWIQHDIYILYGNAAASAPVVNDYFKPAFELDHSTNLSWVYETFDRRPKYDYDDWRDMGEYRPGRWEPSGPITVYGNGGCYTATQRTFANPFTVIGCWLSSNLNSWNNVWSWTLTNPCGITNVVYANGFKRRATANFLCHLMNWPRGANWWSWHDTPAAPAGTGWEALSYSGSAFSISDIIGFALYFYPSDVEVGDATVTLNSAETPVIVVGAEQGNYHLQATLTNEFTTPNEAITLDFVMDVNSSLEIDTAAKTVTWLLDGSRQLQSLTLSKGRTGSGKRQWLRLLPGSNTLRFDDTNTGHVTVTTEWLERYY